MILIQKGETNTYVTNIKEVQTLENPYYLMEIKSKDSKETTTTFLTDFSTATNFVEFLLIEGGSASSDWILTEGDWEDELEWVDDSPWIDFEGEIPNSITLDEGTYDFAIYESLYSDLNVASASSILQTGLMRVKGTASFSRIIEDYSDDLDYIVFKYDDE